MANLIHNLFQQPLFVGLVVLLACLCFYYLKSEKKDQRKIIWIAYSLIFFLVLFTFIGSAIYRIFHPEIWDFTCFYLYGKVADAGHNFYLPENFHQVFNSLNLPFSDYKGLIEEVVNVGFPYPPPTILYFIPLGFLSFKTALICWTIFNLIFVFGCIYLIFEMFFKASKLNGLLLVSILFFILPASQLTITDSQTNFILLFWLLLMRKYSNKKISGFFLALAIFTKPYMAIFGVFFLIQKKWKPIIYCIITALILVGVIFIAFGKEVFVSYMFDNPLHRLPEYVFHERAYQSLFAVLIRANLISYDASATYTYIVMGIGLMTVGYLFYLLKRKLYDYLWVSLLLIAIMIYPGTLRHYGVPLLFIIFQFFDSKKQLGFKSYLNIPIITIFYCLSAFSVFTSICFLLIVVVFKSIWPIISKRINLSQDF